ncbi:MAG: alginate lyase family protein [Prolixibacteraceae bacterium]|nr:alginate lyase family protein [Prolixibacteraceae bacterium]
MNRNLIPNSIGQFFRVACLILCAFFFFFLNGLAQSSSFNAEAKKLLTRLNLNLPELEQVGQSQENPEMAIQYLLKYYQSRTSVKHPVEREFRESGKTVSSGDLQMADNALKHIFVGQSAYPPYFCGDDINWGTRPVPDNEWVWQLNRMSFWGAMARVYRQTGDEKYAKEWAYQLVDWTRKNPNEADHKHAWRSIEAGIRGHSWTSHYQYFIGSPHFTPEVLVAFLNSCYDHAEYLMTVYRSKSNWGLMEAEGMAFIAMTFPEFKDSEKWLTEAIRRLNNEIDLQVYPDGHQRELAMGYHLGCIEWFIRTYDMARMNGRTDAFPASYEQKVQKMCEVPMKLCHPDGTNQQFGDAWAGKPGQHKDKFAEWAERFNRQDFLYLATDGKQGKKPDSTAFALPYSGLYSMRSGWDKNAICLILKCGPDGGGHSQPDNGTFELSAGGRNLMPDAGSFIYSGDPEGRAWFRETKIHQTLTLNGENSKYAPKLLLWKPGKTTDILVVENQSYENLKHRRSVFFIDKKYFIVVDEAIGTATGDVDVHFQFAPGDAIFNRENFSVNSNFNEGWNIMVKTLPQPGLELSEEEGQVSFLYTKKEPRPAFHYRINKATDGAHVRFVTLVAPYAKQVPDIKFKILGNPEVGSSELNLEIQEKDKTKQIGYSL